MSDPLETSETWERQPGEPNLWFARFELFRLAGPGRSLLGVVNAQRQAQGGRPGRSIPQAWAKNAKRWRWRERADAWAQFQRREARQAHAHALQEMNNRHIQEAQALQSKAIQRLKSLDVAHLSPAHLLRFVAEATKLERLALGESQQEGEETQSLNQAGDATSYSVEDAVEADRELEEYRRAQLHQRGDQTVPNGGPQVP